MGAWLLRSVCKLSEVMKMFCLLIEVVAIQVYVFVETDQIVYIFRVLAEGSLGRVRGVQDNRPQCFQSSEATRMQRVRRTKQGPDALLNPLESPLWAQSSWACDVAKAPKLSVLVGVTHPCWGFGAGDFLQDPLGRGQNESCFPTPISGRGARTSSQGISVSKNLYSAFVLRYLKSQ